MIKTSLVMFPAFCLLLKNKRNLFLYRVLHEVADDQCYKYNIFEGIVFFMLCFQLQMKRILRKAVHCIFTFSNYSIFFFFFFSIEFWVINKLSDLLVFIRVLFTPQQNSLRFARSGSEVTRGNHERLFSLVT